MNHLVLVQPVELFLKVFEPFLQIGGSLHYTLELGLLLLLLRKRKKTFISITLSHQLLGILYLLLEVFFLVVIYIFIGLAHSLHLPHLEVHGIVRSLERFVECVHSRLQLVSLSLRLVSPGYPALQSVHALEKEVDKFSGKHYESTDSRGGDSRFQTFEG